MRSHPLAVGVLAASGAAAVAFALVWPRVQFLVLFGALDRLEGPFGLPFRWQAGLALVVGGLGTAALITAGMWAARPSVARRLALPAAILLLLGTVYLLAWVIDPPEVSVSLGVGGFEPAWPVLGAVASLGAATVAAGVLALRARGRA